MIKGVKDYKTVSGFDKFREYQVFVAGAYRFQNELTAAYVRAMTGVLVRSLAVEDVIAQFEKESGEAARLLLLDCLAMNEGAVLETVGCAATLLSAADHLVLFNLNRDLDVEMEALDSGVKGFFYQHEGEECLLDGLTLILNGEIRIPRKKLQDCYFRKDVEARVSNEALDSLTLRERELLGLVGQGDTNDAIAGKLCISPYTVKTHLYRIYKKIQVRSRFHAALWATKHLQ